MKITRQQLAQIINEETEAIQKEGFFGNLFGKKKAAAKKAGQSSAPEDAEIKPPSGRERLSALDQVVTDLYHKWNDSSWQKKMRSGEQKNLLDAIIRQTGVRPPLAPNRDQIRDALLQITNAYNVEGISWHTISQLNEFGAAARKALGLGHKPVVVPPEETKGLAFVGDGKHGGAKGLGMRENNKLTLTDLQQIIQEEIVKLNEEK